MSYTHLTKTELVFIEEYHVQRQINQVAKQFIPHYKALLKNLSFEEFKYAKGAMAFEYIYAETGDILDILDQRDNFTIKNNFIVNYSLTDRQHVETVTIDRNAGYVSGIKELYPRAKISIDRFHLVQLINRSMNNHHTISEKMCRDAKKSHPYTSRHLGNSKEVVLSKATQRQLHTQPLVYG